MSVKEEKIAQGKKWEHKFPMASWPERVTNIENYITVHKIHNSPALSVNNDSKEAGWSHILIQNQHFGDYLHMYYMGSIIDCFMYRLLSRNSLHDNTNSQRAFINFDSDSFD